MHCGVAAGLLLLPFRHYAEFDNKPHSNAINNIWRKLPNSINWISFRHKLDNSPTDLFIRSLRCIPPPHTKNFVHKFSPPLGPRAHHFQFFFRLHFAQHPSNSQICIHTETACPFNQFTRAPLFSAMCHFSYAGPIDCALHRLLTLKSACIVLFGCSTPNVLNIVCLSVWWKYRHDLLPNSQKSLADNYIYKKNGLLQSNNCDEARGGIPKSERRQTNIKLRFSSWNVSVVGGNWLDWWWWWLQMALVLPAIAGVDRVSKHFRRPPINLSPTRCQLTSLIPSTIHYFYYQFI